MKKVFSLLCLLVAVQPTVPAEAQDFQVFFAKHREIREAWDRGDLAAVGRLTRPFAEQGDVRAQSLLGTLYFSGLDVTQDDAEARPQSRKANGHHQSRQCNLDHNKPIDLDQIMK